MGRPAASALLQPGLHPDLRPLPRAEVGAAAPVEAPCRSPAPEPCATRARPLTPHGCAHVRVEPTQRQVHPRRKDNWLGAQAFTLVATLAGFAVPVEVGGARLAYLATASDTEVPSGSYFSAATGSRAASRVEGFEEGVVSPEGADEAKAATLWDRTVDLTAPYM